MTHPGVCTFQIPQNEIHNIEVEPPNRSILLARGSLTCRQHPILAISIHTSMEMMGRGSKREMGKERRWGVRQGIGKGVKEKGRKRGGGGSRVRQEERGKERE